MVPTHFAGDLFFEGAEVTAEIGATKLIVERAPPSGPSSIFEGAGNAPVCRDRFPTAARAGDAQIRNEKPVMPAFGFEPVPVAPSSRISPPAPVAAPGNGEIAVGGCASRPS